jgi:hypothetical protein
LCEFGVKFGRTLKSFLWDFNITPENKLNFNSNKLTDYNPWKLELSFNFTGYEFFFNILPEYKNDNTRRFGIRLNF